MSTQFDALIDEAARQYGVDPALVRQVIAAESNWNPRAVSRVGAQGLMQLMPKTAGELGVTDPFDPKQNIGAGVKYLSQMMQRFGGDQRKALAAYNFGPTAVAAGRPWPAETTAYVDKILGGMPRPSLSPTPTSAPAPAPMARPNPRPAPPPTIPRTPYTGDDVSTAIGRATGQVGNFMRSLGDRASGAFSSAMAAVRPTPVQPSAPPPPQMASLPPRSLRPLGAPLGVPQPPVSEFSMPEEETPPAVTSQVSRQHDPTLEALRTHAGSMPRREDYQHRGWNRALGVLASAAAGYAGGPGQGIATAEHVFNAPYQRALQEHRTRGEELYNVARAEDQAFDRALRRDTMEQTGRYQDIMGKAAVRRAEADMLEAQNRRDYMKIGPEKVVPFNQLDNARQAVMERMFVTDARAKKYLQPIQDSSGNLTGTFTIKPQFDRSMWFDRDWNEQELTELKELLAEIDKQARGFVGTMVDPYASRRRPNGLGVPEDDF